MANQSLAYRYATANIAMKLIVINVAVYVVFNLIPWLTGLNLFWVQKYFVLYNIPFDFITQPWSVLSYSFFHGSFRHILWNMIGLYFISRFVLNLFTERRFLTIYLLGAACGGLLFFGLSNVLPVLEQRSYLIGASAAVSAVLVFMGTYTPNAEVRIFTFTIKLWHIAVAFVVINLLSLPSSDNAGGLISHLGGAAFGYIYAKQLAKGKDIGEWFEKWMDLVAGWFSKTPKRKKTPLRTVHKTKKPKTSTAQSSKSKSAEQQKIDAILDKISKSGYDSLSTEEKDFLFKAGKD
jgi:membrane associated rhomboid family serine protease